MTVIYAITIVTIGTAGQSPSPLPLCDYIQILATQAKFSQWVWLSISIDPAVQSQRVLLFPIKYEVLCENGVGDQSWNQLSPEF